MPRRKNTRELGMLTTQNPSDHHYLGQISIDSIEPELQSLTSVCLYAYSAQCHDSAPAQNRGHLKGYSVSKEWHRPYIEAFLETDNAELGALIAEAERAVVGRFLELLVSAVETDEFLDLQSAASALTQLKKARVFVDTPQHLVA
jgi:hypothetical protein